MSAFEGGKTDSVRTSAPERKVSSMPLTLTDDAVEAVQEIISSTPEIRAIRIVANESEGEISLELRGVAEPGESDEVVEEQGVSVFLEPAVAEVLDDKTLDARVGANDKVSFLLFEQ